MNEITQWLEGQKDYFQGLMLFGKYGRKGAMQKLLQRGPNKYNTPKLERELKKLEPKGQQVEKKEQDPANNEDQGGQGPQLQKNPGGIQIPSEVVQGSINWEGFSESKLQDVDPKLMPEELQKLRMVRINAYTQMSRIHRGLKDMQCEEDRQVAAEEILELHDRIVAIFEVLDHFAKTGEIIEVRLSDHTMVEAPTSTKEALTPSEDFTKLSVVDLMKKRDNIRSNKSKKKKKLEAMDPKSDKCAAIQHGIDQLEIDLLEVDKLINAAS